MARADYWTAERRGEALAQGHALPPLHDGEEPRYPIETCEDVHDAIRSLGRTEPSERPVVRAYIVRQATRLGCPLPETWKVRPVHERS